MGQPETMTRVRLSGEAVQKLQSLVRDNKCDEREIVGWVVCHHTWWINELYALPRDEELPLYKTQLRKHRQRVNRVKGLIAGMGRVKVPIGCYERRALERLKRITGLPIGGILSIALTNLRFSNEMNEVRGVSYMKDVYFIELLQKRKSIAREVAAMEELWEKVLVMSWREDTTIGYRKLLAFFTAFHELGEYPCLE